MTAGEMNKKALAEWRPSVDRGLDQLGYSAGKKRHFYAVLGRLLAGMPDGGEPVFLNITPVRLCLQWAWFDPTREGGRIWECGVVVSNNGIPHHVFLRYNPSSRVEIWIYNHSIPDTPDWPEMIMQTRKKLLGPLLLKEAV